MQALRATQVRSGVRHVPVRRARLVVQNAFVLRPTGSGSTDHLDGAQVKMAGPFVITDGKYLVGRAPGNDLQIEIITVSGKHALVEVEGDKVLITDLMSTNGTKVDGKDLPANETVQVALGSEIIFGDGDLARFALEVVPSEPAPEAPAAAPAPAEPAPEAPSQPVSA